MQLRFWKKHEKKSITGIKSIRELIFVDTKKTSTTGFLILARDTRGTLTTRGTFEIMIKRAKWVVQEAKLRIKYMVSKDCIFCKMLKGEIKTSVIAENDGVFAINDINPVAKVHVLIIPKKHIDSVLTLKSEDGQMLLAMFDLAGELTQKLELEAFRLTFNGGKFQHVAHVHMHLLAGSKIEWEKL